MSARVVFIHGRPGPHPFHASLARSLGAESLPVDFLLRWHDRPSSRLRRYMSWIICSLFFPRRSQYNVFLTEGPHFLPLIMRRLGLLDRRQRVVALMANETLYFLKTARYSRPTRLALLEALRACDALICIGRMQATLAGETLLSSRRAPLVLTVRSGVARDRQEALVRVEPSLDGRALLFVGNGPSGWRGWYKGLDLLLHATALAASRVTGVSLSVVGEWDRAYVDELLSALPVRPARVDLLGRRADLRPVLAESSLYVHLGRGEAFGISVLEAMCAGVPALVSEWTGAREVVEQVDSRLVVPLDAAIAAERICWYLNLPTAEKAALSARAREVATGYPEDRAIREFVSGFRDLLTQFALPDLSSPAVETYGREN